MPGGLSGVDDSNGPRLKRPSPTLHQGGEGLWLSDLVFGQGTGSRSDRPGGDKLVSGLGRGPVQQAGVRAGGTGASVAQRVARGFTSVDDSNTFEGSSRG